MQAIYLCKPFREKIIQYKLEYNQRTLNLSSKDLTSTNSNDNSSNLNDINSISSSNGTHTNSANNTNLNGGSSSSSSNNNSNTFNANSLKEINKSNGTPSVLKQEHLLNCLAELFYSIVTMKKKKGIIQPKKFIARLRKDNDAFDNLFQQDAHEFLNYLLNTCADLLKAEMKELKELKKLEEKNRLNESSVRLSTKTH